MAESEGFEPPIPFRVRRFSRPMPSTTRPALRFREPVSPDQFTVTPTISPHRPPPPTCQTSPPVPCRLLRSLVSLSGSLPERSRRVPFSLCSLVSCSPFPVPCSLHFPVPCSPHFPVAWSLLYPPSHPASPSRATLPLLLQKSGGSKIKTAYKALQFFF